MSNSIFNQIQFNLNSIFVERSEEIEGLIIGLLARKHVFLLGAPGTGKSKLISTFADCVSAKNFTWQLSRFSTPEELSDPSA